MMNEKPQKGSKKKKTRKVNENYFRHNLGRVQAVSQITEQIFSQ